MATAGLAPSSEFSRGSSEAPAGTSASAAEPDPEMLLFWDRKEMRVEAATRSLTPLHQVAENITVITAKEIADLHAHSVADVLARVPGVFVDFMGTDFVAPSDILIQGSNSRHALVLVDGIPWNSVTDNHAETLTVPLGIIDRIEIVKGPASSAWGSSLGGVVNILTKRPGLSARPAGTVAASFARASSQDYSAEVLGRLGSVGYFFHAGHLESDGLRADRRFRSNGAYAKLRFSPGQNLVVTATGGHSEVQKRFFSLPELGLTDQGLVRPSFGTLSLDGGLSPQVRVSVSGFAARTPYRLELSDLQSRQSVLRRGGRETVLGGTAKILGAIGAHKAVLGLDVSRGLIRRETNDLHVSATVDKWALFANDTWSAGAFSVTPGYRFDHNDISGKFHSPSLGATFQVGSQSLVRAAVARGFSEPPVAHTRTGDGLFLLPNPDLEPEKVWSYQLGAETVAADRLWLKATVFYHQQRDMIERVLDALGPFQDRMENTGHLNTRGIELEAETEPFRHVAVKASTAYVYLDPVPENITTGRYAYGAVLKYDDKVSWSAQLGATYRKWLVRPDIGRSNGVVLDAAVRRRMPLGSDLLLELFVAGHNLLNTSEYTNALVPNARRWLELGARVAF